MFFLTVTKNYMPIRSVNYGCSYEGKRVAYPLITCFKTLNIMAKTKTPNNSSRKGTTASGAAKGNSQLEQFFHETLKDLYWAEKHLVTALPKMQEAATSE